MSLFWSFLRYAMGAEGRSYEHDPAWLSAQVGALRQEFKDAQTVRDAQLRALETLTSQVTGLMKSVHRIENFGLQVAVIVITAIVGYVVSILT